MRKLENVNIQVIPQDNGEHVIKVLAELPGHVSESLIIRYYNPKIGVLARKEFNSLYKGLYSYPKFLSDYVKTTHENNRTYIEVQFSERFT